MRCSKTWLWTYLAAALIGLAVGSSNAQAQDRPKDDGGAAQKSRAEQQSANTGKALRPGEEFGGWADLVKDLGLSDEQQAKLKEVVKAGREAEAAWEKDNTENIATLKKAAAEARAAGNEEALQKVNTEMKNLLKDLPEARKKVREEMLAVLTPAQQEKLAGLELNRNVVSRYQALVLGLASKDKRGSETEPASGPLQLTDEQKEKIRSICADAAKEPLPADTKDKDRGANAQSDKAFETVRGQVLTPEQNSAVSSGWLQQAVINGRLGILQGKGDDTLKLTDEQVAKIKALCDSAAKNLDLSAGNRGNLESLQKVMEEVKGTLTPEQRSAVEKQMEQSGGREGKPGADAKAGGDAKPSAGDKGK